MNYFLGVDEVNPANGGILYRNVDKFVSKFYNADGVTPLPVATGLKIVIDIMKIHQKGVYDNLMSTGGAPTDLSAQAQYEQRAKIATERLTMWFSAWKAFEKVYGSIDSYIKEFPSQISQLKEMISGKGQGEVPSLYEAIAIFSEWSGDLKKVHEEIQASITESVGKGEFDSPLVSKEYKNTLINLAYRGDTTKMPEGFINAIKAKYTKTGAVKPTHQSVEHETMPEPEAQSKTNRIVLSVLGLAVGSYFLLKG